MRGINLKAHFAVVEYTCSHKDDGRPVTDVEENLGRNKPTLKKCPVCGTSMEPVIYIR